MEPDNLPVPYRAHVTAPAPCGHPYSAVRRGRVPPCRPRRRREPPPCPSRPAATRASAGCGCRSCGPCAGTPSATRPISVTSMRLVQGRIDILRAELARRRDPEAPVEDAAVVSRLLGDPGRHPVPAPHLRPARHADDAARRRVPAARRRESRRGRAVRSGRPDGRGTAHGDGTARPLRTAGLPPPSRFSSAPRTIAARRSPAGTVTGKHK